MEDKTVHWPGFVYTEHDFKKLLGIDMARPVLTVSIDHRSDLITVILANGQEQ